MKKRILAIVVCLAMVFTTYGYIGVNNLAVVHAETGIPACSCNSTLALAYHADKCQQKAYIRNVFIHENSAEEIYAQWNDLSENVQTGVLTMMSWDYNLNAKLNKLKELIKNGDHPSDGTVIESEEGDLTISGSLPKGAKIDVSTPSNKTMEELIGNIDPQIADYFSVMEFHDINIKVNGNKYQPQKDVIVTLKTEVPTDQKVRVFHILDDVEAIKDAIADKKAKSFIAKDTEELADAIEAAATFSDIKNTVYYTTLSSEDGEVAINEDGTISFETDSFSIYAVNAYNDETVKTLLAPNSTITMKRGDVKYFKWEPTPGTTNTGRGTWTVEAGDEYVDFEVYNPNPSYVYVPNVSLTDTRYQYYWLKLTAKEVSGDNKATIQFEYATKGDDGDGDGYVRVQEYFYVQVKETDALLYVDDQVAENGCLVPTFTENINTEGLTYEWSRDDGETVTPASLESPYAVSDGAINIAMDRGGIDAEDANTNNAMKTYTVKVKRGADTIAEANYIVPYGNELLNGSFEYPESVNVTHDYPNGAPGLYWKTTSESVRDNEICQDIEILNYTKDLETMPGNGITVIEATYGMAKLKPGKTFDGTKQFTYDDVDPDCNFPDGIQCAEINCDAPGALYQDILTYPGSFMHWSLSHRARNYAGSSANYGGAWLPDGFSYTIEKNGKTTTLTDQKDYMYVIAAPTDQVEHIKTQDQLNELVRAAGYPVDDFTVQKPTTQYSFDPKGKEVTYNNITYRIWEVATDHTAWKNYASDSTYEVGEGEYLTRFFFAAGSTSHDRAFVAMGNAANYSGGNFIDKVSFSDEMPWRIEYYKDGVLQNDLTETGTVDLNRDTMRYPLNKEASYNNENCSKLDGTTLAQTQINGRPYIGTILDEVYSSHNVLQLYYETYGATVNKQIEIEDYDEFTDKEKQQVKDALTKYTVPFELYKGNEVVAEASVTVDPETLVGTATFIDVKTSEEFNPIPEESYVIKEGNLPEIDGFVLKSKAADSQILTGSRVYAHTATNEYKVRTDLTIEKDVNGLRNDENQSFLFRVQGKDGTLTEGIDVIVRTTGDDSITVTELPIGEYTVTEIGDWSWRYSLDEVTDTDKTVKNLNKETGSATVTVDLDGNTIKFKNTRPLIYWLSGDSHVENRWSGENGNVVKNPVNMNN